MLMEEMIRYFKMNQPSFSDRGLMAQFIVAYGTAFTRLAPGHYDMTMIIRRTVTPLMKHFAPKGKGLNELFREAQATPAVYAMAQPVLLTTGLLTHVSPVYLTDLYRILPRYRLSEI